MNWVTEKAERDRTTKEIEREIRALEKRLKCIGSTDAMCIIGEELEKNLELHFRLNRGPSYGVGYLLEFYSKSKHGQHYKLYPDYSFELAERGHRLYYYDKQAKAEAILPDDTDDVLKLLLSKRLDLYPPTT